MKTSRLVILLLLSCTIFPGFGQQTSPSPTEVIESWYDLQFTPTERDSLRDGLSENRKDYQAIHQYEFNNATPPALYFHPLPPGFVPDTMQNPIHWKLPENVKVPKNPEELAFYSVAALSVLLKNRQITSEALTQMYLNRLKKYGDTLQCVITLTEELAMEQAKRADREIAAGQYRGPLHGIPYGIKDLFAVEGYKTTWGAASYKDQVVERTATIVRKLEEAGAVLVAKLTLGALAMGDVWYGGVTKNPWNLEQGSSGSSAGSSAATAAGLVAFAIGTETWGSIVSPSTRCGVTGLRPTFGRVSRAGAMALSWSMDKAGPICRTAQDCAIVFDAIRGKDEMDQTTLDAVFNYNAEVDLSQLKIGYLKNLFEEENAENQTNNTQALEVLKSLGAELQPVMWPDDIPINTLSIILSAEAAAAFDELTRTGRDSLLVRQDKNAWPNIFRTARFIPAVEYIQANRIRYELVQQIHQLMQQYDVVIAPTFGGNQLLATNLTGHPCVVVPHGFNEKGSPVSISFLGNLLDEATILAVAQAYQEATGWDEQYPPQFLPASANK